MCGDRPGNALTAIGTRHENGLLSLKITPGPPLANGGWGELEDFPEKANRVGAQVTKDSGEVVLCSLAHIKRDLPESHQVRQRKKAGIVEPTEEAKSRLILCDFMINNLPIALMGLDSNLKIIEFNPWAEKVTGYSSEEVIEHFCGDILQGGMCNIRCPLKRSQNNWNLPYKLR
jgi:hypothetical protein